MKEKAKLKKLRREQAKLKITEEQRERQEIHKKQETQLLDFEQKVTQPPHAFGI